MSSPTKQPDAHSDPIYKQRVVVTGMSAITPVGNTLDETWDNLIAGKSGVDKITLIDVSRYSCKIGAEIKGFDAYEHIPRKKGRHMAFASQIAVIAAGQALEDSGLSLESEQRDDIGVIIGTAGGSTIEETEKATKALMSSANGRMSPFQILRFWPNMPAYFIAVEFELRGYNSTVCTACASGTQALGDAFKVVQRGEAEIMLAGGTESMIAESPLAGFTAMKALTSSYNEQPEKASRPFDADREGFVPSQGTAMMILESLDHARKRGAKIYAEVLGIGVSNDAYHMIAPNPQGRGAALAMQRALDDARLSMAEIDYINAHAPSTPLGDKSETYAIKRVFGERAYDIPISSTKSMVGHMMAATGALEAAVCVQTINSNLIHPTINYETLDPECDLDYVPNTAREASINIAMSNSFGLGGQNACLVLGSAPS